MCIQCVDGNDDEHINEVAFEEPQWKSYWDDLTGRDLDRGMVEAAIGGACSRQEDAGLAQGEKGGVLPGQWSPTHQTEVGRHKQGR